MRWAGGYGTLVGDAPVDWNDKEVGGAQRHWSRRDNKHVTTRAHRSEHFQTDPMEAPLYFSEQRRRQESASDIGSRAQPPSGSQHGGKGAELLHLFAAGVATPRTDAGLLSHNNRRAGWSWETKARMVTPCCLRISSRPFLGVFAKVSMSSCARYKCSAEDSTVSSPTFTTVTQPH